MVPNKLPESHNETTTEMRRKQALSNIRNGLVGAVERLHQFLAETDERDVIKRVHTAKTEITNDSDEPEIITYYTLWTDFVDMRLTESGQLLRSDHYDQKYSDAATRGVDKSNVVSFYQLRTDTEKYKYIHLVSLANRLDKFLQPKQ